MDTAAQVHEALKNGDARFEAAEAVASADVHSLMARLKTIYQKWYGRVALDIHDWRWQATALKNHIVAHGAPQGSPSDKPFAADSTTVPVNHAGDVHTSGMGAGVLEQGVDHPVSTAAPGTPTSLGVRTELGKPASIKPKPDAEDPTDASLIKTAPDVTEPGTNAFTAVPGSPVAEQPLPGSHTIHSGGTPDAK